MACRPRCTDGGSLGFRKTRYSYLGRLPRLALTVCMVVAWCGLPQWLHAQAATRPAISDAEREQLKKVADSLEETLHLYAAVDSSLPRDSFDPQTVLKTVGNDDVRLFEWVRDNTAYVPYRGALRGAMGVLMDRMGNSLDRSLLLARLLQLSGRIVRLAHGTLGPDQADGLLTLAWDRSAAPVLPPGEVEPASDEFLTRWAAEKQVNPVQLRREVQQGRLTSEKRLEELTAAVDEQTERLLSLVKPPAAVDPGQHPLLRSAIADHWWVQESRDGQWIDLDVLPRDAKPGARLTEPRETLEMKALDGKLPLKGADFQTIELRVVAEQWKGGALGQQVALRYVMRPAEMVGLPATLSLIPAKWPQDLDATRDDIGQTIRAAMLQQTVWAPVLRVGGESVQQNGFDEHGDLVAHPLDDGAGRSANKSAIDATSALSELDPVPAPVQGKLTAAWIEIETRVPGQKPQVIRRDLFDLYGPAARAAGNLPEPVLDENQKLMRGIGLFQSIDFLTAGEILSANYVLHAQLDRLLGDGPAIVGLLRSAGQKPMAETFADIAGKGLLPAPLLALACARRGIDDSKSGVSVDRPNLFALHHSLTFTKSGRMLRRVAVDVIENGAAMRPAPEVPSFAAKIRQGVMETQLEAAALGPRARHNASLLFAASVSQDIRWVPLRSADDAALAQLKLSPNARARIAADLRSGYVVCAPVSPVKIAGVPQTGWWRIAASDGSCLGYMSDGMGTAAVEHSSLSWWIALAESAWSVVECTSEFHGWAAVGCSACGIAIAVGVAITHTPAFGEIVVGHTMGKMCTAFGGGGEGGEGGGGEGGGGEGGGGGGPNYTPSGGSSQDPGMSSVGGGQ
jgi:hypothetical protein